MTGIAAAVIGVLLAAGASTPWTRATAGGRPNPAEALPLSAFAYPGLDPTGGAASDDGLEAFVQACMGGGGHDCFVPPGRYRLERDLVIDFAHNRAGGVHIHGSGQNASMFRFAPGKQMRIIASGGGGVFYGSFDNFGVLADNPDGAALQLGSADFSDALNGFSFRDVFVKNIAGARTSQGLVLNEVYSSTFSNLTTSAGCSDDEGGCPAGGDSLLLRQAAFNSLQGSFSDGRVGVHLAEGYNFGNVFTALDEEVNYIDLLIDNPQSRFNTFLGGQWNWFQGPGRSHAVMATAGQSNIIDNVNFSGPDAIGTAVGLVVRGGPDLVQTPPFPASGATTLNATGRSISIQIYGLNGAWRVCYGRKAATCIDQSSVGGLVSLPFRPGDGIKLDYRGEAGAWVWTELG